MLGNLFLKIRRKPKHVKDNIAFVTAGTFTVAVFLVWLLNVPSEMIGGAKEESETIKPFATLFSQLKEQTANVGESLEEVSENVASTTPIVEEAAVQSVSASTTVTASGSTPYVPREVQITTVSRASTTASSTQNVE